jgi:hypothetical protein
MLIGAPPQEAAKEDGDHRARFQYRFIKSGRCCLNIRLDTPFRELTSEDTEAGTG